jgi:hypothetical protein
MPQEYVFGYGSLVAPSAGAYATELREAARVWGVAMDNRRDLPGYKFYVLAATGERPAACIAFLDVEDRPGVAVNGVCRPVDRDALATLDRRERNYERIEVTDRVAAACGRVWTYAGRGDSRERLRRARERGDAVIDEGYLESVLQGFEALGAAELERFHRSTDPGGLPVLALERIDLDEAGAAVERV